MFLVYGFEFQNTDTHVNEDPHFSFHVCARARRRVRVVCLLAQYSLTHCSLRSRCAC